jgi:predicted nucleic acid binding AN1-type Zn finger protein
MGTNGKLEHTYILMLENKNIQNENRKFIYLLHFRIAFVTGISCEREISDEVEFATFQNSPEVLSIFWRIKLSRLKVRIFRLYC